MSHISEPDRSIAKSIIYLTVTMYGATRTPNLKQQLTPVEDAALMEYLLFSTVPRSPRIVQSLYVLADKVLVTHAGRAIVTNIGAYSRY